MKAQLVAQPTQQHLKHDIGGHLDEVEGGASPFIEGAMTILAAKHGMLCVEPQVRAIHGKLME